MNDEKNEALNQEGEGNTPDATPAEEENQPEEVVEMEVEAEPEGEAEADGEAAETGDSPKKGFSQRVRELNAKAKEAEAKAAEAEARAESLAEKMRKLTGAVSPEETSFPYEPQIEPGAEISPEQYKQDVMRTADSLVQLRIKQQDAVARINEDSREAIRKHPQLDPDSKDFNRELSDSVTEATEAYVRSNPYSAQIGTFVDKLMKPYQRAVTKEVGEATETLAKQVSQAAQRPTSHRATEKKAEEKSIAELEEELGVVQT